MVEEPIIVNKTYRNVGVGDDPVRVTMQPPVVKKDIGINCLQKSVVSIGIGNHIKCLSYATDCEGLIEEISE